MTPELPLPREVVDGERVVGRQQLGDDALHAAAGLADRGIGPGDPVVVSLPNSYEFVVLERALHYLGAVMVNLPGDARREVGLVGRMVESSLIILGDAADPHLFGDLDQWLSLRGPEDLKKLSTDAEAPPPFAASDESITWLACTSGSTGTPRAAVHTRASLSAGVCALQNRYEIADDDTVLVAAGVGTAIGFRDGVRLGCQSGARIVLQRRSEVAETVHLMSQQRCSFAAVPFSFVYDIIAAGADLRGAGLRHLLAEGSLIDEQVIARADQLTGIGVTSAYYAPLECGPALSFPPGATADERSGAHGLPTPGLSVELIHDDESPLPHSPGVEGQLVVSGPGVALSYLKRNDSDHQFRSDGRFMTCDRAQWRPRGCVAVTGPRSNDVLVRESVAVAPRELEEVISAHPKVGRAVVTGRSDPRLGEAVVAVATAAGEAPSWAEVEAWLAECGVARSKWQDWLLFVDTLPVDAGGKIDRSQIHDLAARRAS
jgi:acyl-CoA synthetase (AMP-forming)/AMP-acid ligase II